MITKELLKDYANKLMFDMNEEEYETLENEFKVILKQMDLIENIENIKDVEPMTFPYLKEDVVLRDDSITRTIDYTDVLVNAKEVKGREIKVPKVVE